MDKTRQLTATATAKAKDVESRAREVTNVAKGAEQASQRQQAAFVRAEAIAGEASMARDEASEAFR